MTLTQAATITKRSIALFIISTVLGTLSWVGLSYYQAYRISQIPPVEVKPELKFGNLPDPIFPQSATSPSNYSYSIDTTTGELPPAEKFIKVYFIPKAGLSFLAPERSKELAVKLGFNNGPEILTEEEYRFTDETGGDLKINITTGNFSSTREASTGAFLSSFPDQELLVTEFKNYLSSKISLPQELTGGKSNTTFDNETDPQLATLSLLPQPIDQIPIVTASFNHGLVKATLNKSSDENLKYQTLNYIYWPIDSTTSSTYPLKTPNQALEDLKGGQGFVSIEPKSSNVSITSSYLGYYQSEEYSSYLLPVYVFEGPSFVALVPGIAQE